MAVPRRWRIQVAGIMLGLASLGWGVGRIRERDVSEAPDLDTLASACRQALGERSPEPKPERFATAYRVRQVADDRYRLVSHFDGEASGRTHFACDALRQGLAWQVEEIAIASW